MSVEYCSPFFMPRMFQLNEMIPVGGSQAKRRAAFDPAHRPPRRPNQLEGEELEAALAIAQVAYDAADDAQAEAEGPGEGGAIFTAPPAAGTAKRADSTPSAEDDATGTDDDKQATTV